MNKVVVVGGSLEGPSALSALAEAAADHFNLEQLETFLSREVVDNPKKLRQAVDDQILITHSAGVLAVTSEVKPEFLMAFNGPEPTSVFNLVKAALIKTGHHASKVVTGPEPCAHAWVLGSNTGELFGYARENIGLKRLRNIAAFSTTDHLLQAGTEISVQSVVMDNDEFFPPQVDTLARAQEFGLDLTQLPGLHDDVLVYPGLVLELAAPA